MTLATTTPSTMSSSESKETTMRFKKSSFRQKLIRINKRWSISRFSKTTTADDDSTTDKLQRCKESADDSYFLNELDETTTNASTTLGGGNSSSLLLHHHHHPYSTTARYSIQSDSYFTSKLLSSFANENSTASDQDKPDLSRLKQRSASLNNSVKSVFSQETAASAKPVLSKAVVIKEFTPSPYDKNSLSLKIGDTIDVIDMNETGIWTGILNKKIGTFKFIHVNIVETILQPIEPVEQRSSTACSSDRSNKTLSITSSSSVSNISRRTKSKSLSSLTEAKDLPSPLRAAHSTPSFNRATDLSLTSSSFLTNSISSSCNNHDVEESTTSSSSSTSTSSSHSSNNSSSSNFSLNDDISSAEKRQLRATDQVIVASSRRSLIDDVK